MAMFGQVYPCHGALSFVRQCGVNICGTICSMRNHIVINYNVFAKIVLPHLSINSLQLNYVCILCHMMTSWREYTFHNTGSLCWETKLFADGFPLRWLVVQSLIFSLLLAWIIFWTNTSVAIEVRCFNAHMVSLETMLTKIYEAILHY